MRSLLLLFLLLVSGLAAEYRVAAVAENLVVYSADGEFGGKGAFLQGVDKRIDALQRDTGIYLEQKADVYIVPDRASYRHLASGKAAIVEFSDAFYSSAERRIYLRSSDQIWENYSDIFLHEYTHWYLDEIFLSAPLWFHEGMATHYAGQMGPQRYLHFVRERFWGNKLDLFALAYEYPAERREWPMYYLSSWFATDYMRNKDEAAWRRFWAITSAHARLGHKTRFVSAFSQAYRSSLYEFNLDFAAYSRRQAWIYLIIGVNSIIFAILPVVLIFAWRKRRKKLLSMPELEPPVDESEQVTDETPSGDEHKLVD